MPVFGTFDHKNQRTPDRTMKFLIVLSAIVALAAAKPGVLGGLGYSAGYPSAFGYTAYSAGVPTAVAAPVAYSSVVHGPTAAAYAAPVIATPAVAAVAPVVAGIKTQYHAQDAHGQASYGHSEPFQAHSAVQDAHGNKVGSFSYVGPNGQVFKTEYVADALGYRVASNALPVGPGPVHDTPEVVAARAAHLAFHHRGKRGIAALAVGHTPAATAPLVHAAVAPLAYASPLAYSADLTHSYAYASPVYSHGLTTVVSAPTVSYIH